MDKLDLTSLRENGEMTVLSGKVRGEQARRLYDIDRLDEVEGTVEVVLPDNLISITPSFVQGMFSKSVRKFESVDAFTRKYLFDASPTILNQVRQGAALSLLRSHALSGI